MARHARVVLIVHAAMSVVPEYVPAPHAVHAESSAEAVPSLYPFPGGHDWMVLSKQDAVSSAAEYVPAPHVEHAESSAEAVPSLYPSPGGHDWMVLVTQDAVSSAAEDGLSGTKQFPLVFCNLIWFKSGSVAISWQKSAAPLPTSLLSTGAYRTPYV